FTIDIGGEAYAPYDPTASTRIADEARKSLGDMVPTDADEIRKAIGYGWWKYDLEAAEKLMLQAGCSRDSAGKWLLPDGSPFSIALLAEGETRPVMNRGAAMIVECWNEFGINASLDVRDNATRIKL